MLRVAVCEDCEMQTEVMLKLLTSYQSERPGLEMEVSAFDSGEALLDALASGNSFNLMLLDILMPGINGIELAGEIRKQDKDVALLFLTSTKDYAVEAFRVYAADYIVKPILESNLFPELDRVIALFKRESEPYFTFTLPKRTVKIPFSSIVCVELVNRKPNVCLENGEMLTGKYIRKSFDAEMAPLLEDGRFFIPHKSYVLNIMHAVELRDNSFVMKNKMLVPIARHKYKNAKERYVAYHI